MTAPEYLFLISELAGERRFASTVARRLESLGALTHGDRRATESRDLSQFNLDTKFGRKALEETLKVPLSSSTSQRRCTAVCRPSWAFKTQPACPLQPATLWRISSLTFGNTLSASGFSTRKVVPRNTGTFGLF